MMRFTWWLSKRICRWWSSTWSRSGLHRTFLQATILPRQATPASIWEWLGILSSRLEYFLFPNSLGQYALLARYTLCLTYVTGEISPPLVASSRKGEDTWRRNPGMHEEVGLKIMSQRSAAESGNILDEKGSSIKHHNKLIKWLYF